MRGAAFNLVRRLPMVGGVILLKSGLAHGAKPVVLLLKIEMLNVEKANLP